MCLRTATCARAWPEMIDILLTTTSVHPTAIPSTVKAGPPFSFCCLRDAEGGKGSKGACREEGGGGRGGRVKGIVVPFRCCQGRCTNLLPFPLPPSPFLPSPLSADLPILIWDFIRHRCITSLPESSRKRSGSAPSPSGGLIEGVDVSTRWNVCWASFCMPS